jgi:hypothetical protein
VEDKRKADAFTCAVAGLAALFESGVVCIALALVRVMLEEFV